MDVLTTLFSFRGRHNRARFFLITLVGLLWLGFCVPAFISYATTTQPAGRAAAAMIIICWLAIAIWCQSANLVKRFHDMGASGWWTLVIYAIGASFGVLGAVASPQARGGIGLIALILGLGTLAIIGGPEGTEGENKYGPDPLAPDILTPPVRTHA